MSSPSETRQPLLPDPAGPPPLPPPPAATRTLQWPSSNALRFQLRPRRPRNWCEWLFWCVLGFAPAAGPVGGAAVAIVGIVWLCLACYRASANGEAESDPAQWPGLEELCIDGLGARLCAQCHRCIDGVRCADGGWVHFGCASSAAQDAAARHGGEIDIESSESGVKDVLELISNFRMACACGDAIYTNTFQVERAFAVGNPQIQQRFERAVHRLEVANVKQLYHGTIADSAKAIIGEGFELPLHSGMFGRGVYFADLPQKSWAYARNSSEGPVRGIVLVCDVALGQTRELAHGAPRLRGHVDSVTGLPATSGGTLRAPEYVVYNPDQILPKYLLCLREVEAETA